MKAVSDKFLKISRDFSSTPGPRYEQEGGYSGEVFRKKVLKPIIESALQERTHLVIDLDGTAGYGTSFLEEAFGGLIREDGFSFDDLNKCLIFISEEEPYLIEDIKSYLEEAVNEN